MQTKRRTSHSRENDIAVHLAYLFGSFASGSPDADSDIDIAVFLDRDEDYIISSQHLRGPRECFSLCGGIHANQE